MTRPSVKRSSNERPARGVLGSLAYTASFVPGSKGGVKRGVKRGSKGGSKGGQKGVKRGSDSVLDVLVTAAD